jgi:cytochrome d ubiquinol oxidase subunit I
MQTPQGYTLTPDGRFLPADWWQVIFNPSFPYRLVHMVIASYLAVAFMVGAVGAWHLRRDVQNQAARLMFSMAMWMAVVVAPIQLLVGDQHGLNTLEHQPAKIAALEGDWETQSGTPLILFGMPNMRAERTDWAVEIPHLGALVLTHSWDGSIKGLKEFPPEDRPYSPVMFWAFRIMVGLGMLMAAIGVWAAWLRVRGRLYASPRLRHAVLAMAPSGFVALLAGWTVTEVGRQPFTVYGMLRTADSASPVGLPGVGASLAGFVVVYAIVFGAGFTFLLRLVRRPPVVGERGPERGVPVRSAGITPAAALQDQR